MQSLLHRGGSPPQPRSGVLVDVLLIAAIACVATSFQFAFANRYANERRSLEARARAERTEELLSFWRTLEFSETSKTDFPGAFVSGIDWGSTGLGQSQEAAARARLEEVIRYLARPTFVDYLRLKSAGVHYRFRLSPRGALLMGCTNRAGLVSDAAPTTRAVWEANLSKRKSSELSQITGICLDSIAVSVTDTNSAPSLVGGKLFKGLTIGYIAPDPGFEYVNTAAQLSSATPRRLFLNCSFYARSNSSTNPGPVHLSFRWSGTDHVWLLDRMISDVQLRLNTMF